MGINGDCMKILLEAPILTQSGYGEHSRLVFRALEDSGHEIFTNPLKWGATSWDIDSASDALKQSIRNFGQYIEESNQQNQNPHFDIQIHVGIANEFEKKAQYSVLVTAGVETDRVSSNWIIKTHQGIDKIIVPSEHAKAGFATTSYEIPDQNLTVECNCPISVVPYPVKLFDNSHPIDLNDIETDFNFLSVALWGPRKNLTNMVRWFFQEFQNEESAGLILKTGVSKCSVIDRTSTIEILENIKKDFKDAKCKLYLLHGSMTEEEIHSLYVNPKIKAYVTTTHGEGFGLPIFEAAYSGLPIIATDWSGHLDFLTGPIKQKNKVKIKKLFSRVSYKLKEVPSSVWWDHIIVQSSKWAFPEEISFRNQLRKMFRDYGVYKKWAKALREQVLSSHSEEEILPLMRQEILGEASNVLNFQNDVQDDGDMIVL